MRMPTARSPSTTTTEPTLCSRMRDAARATVSDSDAVTTGRLMISDTSTARPSVVSPLSLAHNIPLDVERTPCENPDSVR